MFSPICDSLQNHWEHKMLNEITMYLVIILLNKTQWNLIDAPVNNEAHALCASKLILKHWNFQISNKIENRI